MTLSFSRNGGAGAISRRPPAWPETAATAVLAVALSVVASAVMAQATDERTPGQPRRICTDAGAGGYQAFPDVCRLSSGDLLCVFYAGYAHISHPSAELPLGARVCGIRSSDEGRTWSPAFVVADTPYDDRDPSVVETTSGEVICNFFTYYHGGPKRPPGKPDAYKEIWLVRSADHGRTWTKPERIASVADERYGCSSPIRQLSDGALLMPVYREMRDPLGCWSGVIRSTDGGRKWSAPCMIDETNPDNDEPDIVELPDKRLMCMMRTNGGKSMWKSVSGDGGRSWSRPETVGFYGQAPYLLLTKGRVLICSFRGPGTSMRLSMDMGRTWGGNVRIDDCGGAYPSMLELPDGRVLVVYYEEGARSALRQRLFRIDGNEVRFVDP